MIAAAVVPTGDDEGPGAGAELDQSTGTEHSGRDLGAVGADPGKGSVPGDAALTGHCQT
ncbi:hypothetical protein ACU4GR_33810 (plasmid) [Methylobacterium oryzae CBMB20]